MEYSQSKIGRVFVIRFHHGDHLPEVLESLASQENLSCALCFLLGGVKKNGRIVVGPSDEEKRPIEPIIKLLSGVNEICGVGTIFPDESGKPKLHMHAMLGRGEKTVVGCIRLGIDIWQLAEAIVLELTKIDAYRRNDPNLGFDLLSLPTSNNYS